MDTTVILSVISDVSTDQRVKKTATSLHNAGYRVVIVGRKLKNSPGTGSLPFEVTRLRLLFNKGPLLYAEFNFRLFLYLLFRRADILTANDLDTLLANFLISGIKGAKLVYDSHEYFTGVPEIQHRPFVKKVWESIEGWIFPKLRHVYTVNESIADIYSKQYHLDVKVIRNLPVRLNEQFYKADRKTMNLPEDKNILILQGAGINIDRGAEEAIRAMQYLDNTLLLIIGSGDVFNDLKQIVKELKLEDKVSLLGKRPYDELMKYTANADLGLTLDKDTNPNYRYSLPNKFFDYLQAGIPVLSSRLIEIEKIINHYNVGDTTDSHDPAVIADKIRSMLGNKTKMQQWKANTVKAIEELCWENEEPKLLSIYHNVACNDENINAQ